MSRRRSRRLYGKGADRAETPARDIAPSQALARSCLDKARMADEPAARALAMHMIRSGWIKRAKAWVYRCGHCRGWHVTTSGGGAQYGTASVTAADPYVLPEAQPEVRP